MRMCLWMEWKRVVVYLFVCFRAGNTMVGEHEANFKLNCVECKGVATYAVFHVSEKKGSLKLWWIEVFKFV